MSKKSESGTGGASITPSARPSIHSHPGTCPFAMGKHGLHTSSNAEPRQKFSPQRDEGVDVTDNAMSKMSPNTSNNFKNYTQTNKRRSSCDNTHQSNEEVTFENIRRVLATSLPTRLPSRPCNFREDSDNSQEQLFANKSSQSSKSNTSGANRSNEAQSRQRWLANTGTPYNCGPLRGSTQEGGYSAHKPNAVGPLAIFLGIVLIGVSSITYIGLTYDKPTTATPYYNQAQFSGDLNELGEKYKISEDSILQLKTGILSISQKADAGSFIFVYNSNANNFDATQFRNFIIAVSSAAAKYLRNESTLYQPIVVDGSKLKTEVTTHGDLITRFRHDVARSGVMLVNHVEEVPSSLAMAFHYYCDEYNPLAKKSAILFTLDLAKCNQLTENHLDSLTPHSRVEKCLASKWKGLPSDSIGPLLTRVIDIVVDVTTRY